MAQSPNAGRYREIERKSERDRHVSAGVLENEGGCGVEGGTDWGGMNVLREEGVSLARHSISLFTCVKTDQPVRGA